MKTLLQGVIFVVGILLILYSMFMATVSNFNLGIFATLAFGIFLMVFKKLHKWLDHFQNKRLIAVVKCIALAACLLVVVIISMLVFVGQQDTTTFDDDAIIVLGAGVRGETVSLTLKHRLDKAVEYWNKNQKAIIVVSGGQGPQEDISEALAMKRYLVKNNIPDDIIIMEDQSTSTYENFVYSKKILDDVFKESYSIVYITNDFHIYRAGQIADLVGLENTRFAAKTAWSTIPNAYLREVLAVVKSWVFGY